MVEVKSEIQTLEERREDFDNFGYNLMDCSSCLLVKMGEKANYSGIWPPLGRFYLKIFLSRASLRTLRRLTKEPLS